MVAVRKHKVPSLLETFIGCLLGAAIGDALGMPNEDLTLQERNLYYGGEIRDFRDPHDNTPCRSLRAGQHTDDTQLILVVAESLVKSNGFNPEHLSRKLIDWLDMKDDGRYRGEATKQGIKNLKKGVPWHDAGVDKAGCGSATRAIPFGLYYHSSINEAVNYARLASCMTHNNDLAKDGAACIATIIASLINREVPTIVDLKNKVETLEFKNKLDDVERCLGKSYGVPRAIEILGNSSIAHETVALALFIFLCETSHFEAAVLAGANAVGKSKKGDTDSIACLVGAMSGTYNGIGALPTKWAERVESNERLREVGLQLFEAASHGNT